MTGIPTLPSAPSPSPNATSANNSPLGISSQGFLTLLVAQSKYQDPLSPSDPADTLQQFASLAQVSGLQDIKATLEQLLTSQKMSSDAASWIGRSALVPSTTAVPLPDGSYSGEAWIASTSAIDITFTDANGAIVHSEHIAGPITGHVDFRWDGLVAGVPVKGPLKILAMAGESPAGIAVWTPVNSVRTPAQSVPLIETPLGSFAPAAVLDLK